MGCKILHPAIEQGCYTELVFINPSKKRGVKKMLYLVSDSLLGNDELNAAFSLYTRQEPFVF